MDQILVASGHGSWREHQAACAAGDSKEDEEEEGGGTRVEEG